jgi:hypothetical protein
VSGRITHARFDAAFDELPPEEESPEEPGPAAEQPARAMVEAATTAARPRMVLFKASLPFSEAGAAKPPVPRRRGTRRLYPGRHAGDVTRHITMQ